MAVSSIKSLFKRSSLTRPLIAGLVVGGASIVAIRLVLTGLVGAYLAVSFAVLTIVALGILYRESFPTAKREERLTAGDNLYYLGLLFTLLSLILALIQLFVLNAEGEVDERAYQLIGNFGIALVSTVAGIVARILLHSGIADHNQDSYGQEEDVSGWSGENTLGDELRRMRTVLRSATDAFSHFNRVTNTLAHDTLTHTASETRKFNEGTVAAASAQLQALRELTEKLSSQSERLARHFEQAVSDLRTRLAAEAQRSMDVTVAAWHQAGSDMHSAALKQMEQLYGTLNNQVETICSDVKRLTLATEGAWSEMTKLSERILSAGRQVGTIGPEVGKIIQNSGDANRSMTRFIEQMDAAQRRLNATAEVAASAAQRTIESAEQIQRLEDSVQSQLARVSDATLEGYRATIAELSDQTRAQWATDGEEWVNKAKATNQELDRHREAAIQNLSRAQRFSEQMADEATQWQNLADQTRHSLVDAIGSLTKQINRK